MVLNCLLVLSSIWIELFTKVPLNFVISENSQNLFSYLTRDMNYENWKQKSNQAKIHVMGPIKIKWWVMETQQTNWLSNTIGSLGLTHNFFFFFEKHNTQPGQEFQLSTFNFQLYNGQNQHWQEWTSTYSSPWKAKCFLWSTDESSWE